MALSRQKLNTPANQVSTWYSPPLQKRLTTSQARSPVDSGKRGGCYQLPRPELTRSRLEQSGLGVSRMAVLQHVYMSGLGVLRHRSCWALEDYPAIFATWAETGPRQQAVLPYETGYTGPHSCHGSCCELKGDHLRI